MPISFIHLSDIHFGQEKGSEVIVHDDVKEHLIRDAARLVQTRTGGSATGVIVTGDIAYGGKLEEYDQAGEWLDRLTAAIGCPRTSVQVVPGNHDIDRDAISSGCQLMLDKILEKGTEKLDDFLSNELDREVLYSRFSGYRPFAEGYDCPLDGNGGLASDRPFVIAPYRTLRFIGLNSALICSAKDKKGLLILGARQHVLPRNDGEELVVLAHHPLDWLQDSADTLHYVRSRARVFISGHEHNPALRIENINEGRDLLTLAAGATVPPRVTEGYTYTYNLLIFDWDSDTDGLSVTVIPRAWSKEETDFIADDVRLGESEPTTVLGCPQFRRGKNVETELNIDLDHSVVNTEIPPIFSENQAAPSEIEGSVKGGSMPDTFAILLLRFFRDLSPTQRNAVLWKLKVLPESFRTPLTHTIERKIVDSLAKSNRLAELEDAINEIQSESDNQN